MKRAKRLWSSVVSFENMMGASIGAMRGKRWKRDVLEFRHQLEQNVIRLQEALVSGTYKPGPYREFEIYEPKRRRISAASFQDRVVHHALCQVIEPILDRGFVCSYANRKGHGTGKALRSFQRMFDVSPYVLKGDIRKFFPSVDHEILKTMLRRRIACAPTLGLVDTIIDGSNPQESNDEYFPGDTLFTPLERRRGLPIGNLTSQLFANCYLSPLDHFVKEVLRCRRYVRFVDDFALFGESREQLATWRSSIARFLEGLRLSLHPVKTQIVAQRFGVNFLGFRFTPGGARVRSGARRRGERRIRHHVALWNNGEMSLRDLQLSAESWFAHLRFGSTNRLIAAILERHPELARSWCGPKGRNVM